MPAKKTKKPRLVRAPRARRRAVKTTASIAVLAQLDEGADTIKAVAKGARMTDRAVQQTLGRLRKKDPPQVKRTNKHGIGVIAKFKITGAGRKVLRKAVKELQL